MRRLDAFREEFALWAKGELEDVLFQPKNARLLFAYFGISRAARCRTTLTAIQSTIARKTQLSRILGDDEHRLGRLVLLRDPTDERYPLTHRRTAGRSVAGSRVAPSR